jgi:hypothetical protein
MEKQYWFRAKKYGWGWTPSTWQGWGITSLYCFSIAGITLGVLPRIENANNENEMLVYLLTYISILIISTSIMIFVAYKYGENPGRFKLWK